MKKWMIMVMSFFLSACHVSKAEKQEAYKCERCQAPFVSHPNGHG